jgi:predicted lipid-binding transport protein (Tim44 family)
MISLDIIFFAFFAAFVIFKLSTLLGKKDGEADLLTRLSKTLEETERQYAATQSKQANSKIVDVKVEAKQPEVQKTKLSATAEIGVNQIIAADKSFKIDAFMEGAKDAFEMIIDAFNKNDRETLQNLLAGNIYADFAKTLDDLVAKNLKSHTTLVAISNAEVLQAGVNGKIASIEVKFLTEQVALIKDESGNVVDGHPSNFEKVEDTWVFERDVTSQSPDWMVTRV